MLARWLLTFLIALPVAGEAWADRATWMQSARAEAQEALAGVAGGARELVVRWAPGRPVPSVVRGMRLAVAGQSASHRARAFLRQHRGLVLHESRLRQTAVRRSKNRTVVVFQQTHRGLPVLGAMATVAMDRRGRVRSLHSSVRLINVERVVPAVDARRAVRLATRTVTGTEADDGGAALAVSPQGGGLLVHVVTLPMTADPLGRRHLIDATTGRYLGWLPGVRVDGEVWR